MNRSLKSLLLVLMMLAGLPSVFAQESEWPRTLPLNQGMVTIYSLQVDGFNDNIIQFRAALAYRATPGAEPVFGAGWFESPAKIDSVNRIVHPTDLTLTETRFPAGTDDIQSELAIVLAQQSAGWNLDFSVDELDAALKSAESEIEAVKTAPPKIVYRDHPALLISIDGKPVLREVENSPYEAVINTPYPLIFDGKYYYLNAAKDVWYRARKATGPYQFETTPPAAIAAMVNPDDAATTEEQPVEVITAANAPEIVVSTEPTELIVTEGPAAFVPLVDDLLVLQNSDQDVFMNVTSQKFYIVLAGRWYQANSLTGPWAYQAADELPRAFANIPRDSNQADSRVYVAGTEEARDAVLDAQVPQTAAVKRGEVDIEVNYDGEPVYQPVDGTDLVYIQNTGSTVLVSGGLYYLVEEGVWYVSSSPKGPWQVSDHRPEQVDTILPTSPVYNTKYVYVYDSTPSLVYVGYTPGYVGSYVYRNTLFYGTGWYYQPWVSPYYYYPRFSTWGFNVSYNYWSGWNFGLSWGWGPFSVAYYPGGYWHHNHHWYQSQYHRWGPGRYKFRPVYHNRGYDRYAHNGYRSGKHGGYDGGHEGRGNSKTRGNQRNYNLYRDESQRARVANTRDNTPRSSNRYAADTRRVNNTNLDGHRVQSYSGKNKVERNRTGPVSSSELRAKARVRDADLDANRSGMLADNSGNVYQKTNRKSDRVSHLGGVGNPERPTNPASAQTAKVRAADNRRTPQSSPADNSPVRQSQNRTINNRQRAPSTVKEPVRQSQPRSPTGNTRQQYASAHTTNRQSQITTSDKSSRQRSPTQVSASPRQSQSRISVSDTRQRSKIASNTAAQQPRQVNSRNNTSQKSVRPVSVPTQRQSSSPPSQQVNSARNSGPKNPVPAQKAPQQNAQASRHQGKAAKPSNNTGKRNSSSHARER